MSESKKTLQRMMDEIIAEYGYGEAMLMLAGLVGWQTRWCGMEHSLEGAEACALAAKAAAIILKIEREQLLDEFSKREAAEC